MTTVNQLEALPCPFCGGPADVDAYDRLISIGCKACGYSRGFRGLLQSAESPVRVSDQEFYHEHARTDALRAWNVRFLATHAGADGWKPIETAPKDGTMFLCWVQAERWSHPDGGGSGLAHDVSQIDFCWWRVVPDSPAGGYFDAACGQIGDNQGVTHWAPLPAPPAPEALEVKL